MLDKEDFVRFPLELIGALQKDGGELIIATAYFLQVDDNVYSRPCTFSAWAGEQDTLRLCAFGLLLVLVRTQLLCGQKGCIRKVTAGKGLKGGIIHRLQ